MSKRVSLYLTIDQPEEPRRLVQASFVPFEIGTHETADVSIASRRPVRLVIDRHEGGYAVSVFPLEGVPHASRRVQLKSGVFLNIGGVRMRFLCSPVPEELKGELLDTPMEILERQRDVLEEPPRARRIGPLAYRPRELILPPLRRPTAPPRASGEIDDDQAVRSLEALVESLDRLTAR